MLSDFLQDQATLYVSGLMNPEERANFDVVIDYHEELRDCVLSMAEVGTRLITTASPGSLKPPASLKSRVTAQIAARGMEFSPEGRVLCDSDGRVQWVNDAFTAMCGHSLTELRGKKPGPILQGRDTDPASIDRMRRAVHQCRSCTETLLNYHKNGDAYWVQVSIAPILDDRGELLWFVARERELKNHAAASN
jgi:PAS domain S-box-containing protein